MIEQRYRKPSIFERLLLLGFLLFLSQTGAAQLSANSGINSSDTYVIFDLTLQASGTLSLPHAVTLANGTTTSQLATSINQSHYHIELGFDSNDELVMNMQPTDPVDPDASASETVGMIKLRQNRVTLYTQSGTSIPILAATPSVVVSSLFPGGLPMTQSLTTLLAPTSPSALAQMLSATLTTGPQAMR